MNAILPNKTRKKQQLGWAISSHSNNRFARKMQRIWRPNIGRAVGLTVLAILCLPVPEARSWGREGHAIAAQIAEHRLTPAAHGAVLEMLNGGSLASISYWAEEIRPNRRETSRWHFINFAEGTTGYLPARDCVSVPG